MTSRSQDGHSDVSQNLVCNGSHGISVGSLGQYVNEFDIAANLTIFNVSMSNAGTGARIKVWPGVQSSEGALLNGGGGSGYVKNVTYQVFNNTNNDWAIQIDQLSTILLYQSKDL